MREKAIPTMTRDCMRQIDRLLNSNDQRDRRVGLIKLAVLHAHGDFCMADKGEMDAEDVTNAIWLAMGADTCWRRIEEKLDVEEIKTVERVFNCLRTMIDSLANRVVTNVLKEHLAKLDEKYAKTKGRN